MSVFTPVPGWLCPSNSIVEVGIWERENSWQFWYPGLFFSTILVVLCFPHEVEDSIFMFVKNYIVIALAKTSGAILRKYEESGHHSLVLILVQMFCFSLSRMILLWGCYKSLLLCWKMSPVSIVSRTFIMKGHWILSAVFFASNDHVYFYILVCLYVALHLLICLCWTTLHIWGWSQHGLGG